MQRFTLMAYLLMLAPALGGCTALTSTTNGVANVASSITGAVTNTTDATSEATTNVTRPGGADYARATQYVESNLAYIRRDAATGGGERVDVLATLLGEDDHEAFGRWMQAHYEVLFEELEQPADLIARIEARRG